MYCDEMKYLLNTIDWVAPPVSFCNLESLSLYRTYKFTEICHGQLPAESFSKLQELVVFYCDSMSNIVPSNLVRRLLHLRRLSADSCDSLISVFDLEGLAAITTETTEMIKFLSTLETLDLDFMPELMHVWKGPHHVVSVCNLKSVSLNQCDKITQLFSATLLHGLVNLENLEIDRCKRLEEVFGKQHDQEEQLELDEKKKIVQLEMEQGPSSVTCLQNMTSSSSPSETITEEEKGGGGGVMVEKILFPRLYSIRLSGLNSLTCFCRGRYAVEFPSLETVEIRNCPKMETFGYGDLATPKLKKVNDLFDRGIWKGDLNATVHHIFKEEAKAHEQDAEASLPQNFPSTI